MITTLDPSPARRPRWLPRSFGPAALLGLTLATPAATAGRPDLSGWLQAAAIPTPARGSARLRELQARKRIAEALPGMVALLQELVDQNSGSRHAEGIGRVLARVRRELEPLGFTFEYLPAIAGGGPHLVARRHGSGRRILMVGHVDTIFEPDESFQRMEVDGDRARGPGVRDMKGGVVVMLQVLRTLHVLGALEGHPVTLVFNGDEETGSLTSRAVLEREARHADIGLVYEGSWEGRLTTSRGGLGQARFTIEGVPAHIASRPSAVDANQELAEKMVRLLALNDLPRRTFVNVAPVQGGSKRNQVSGRATGELDLRFRTVAQGAELEAKVRHILETSHVVNPGTGRATRTAYTLVLHRPPFSEDRGIRGLAEVFQQVGSELGRKLRRVSSAGGSDQNLLAATGLPCLDSLGVDGFGAHTDEETALLSSLVPATELSTLAILRLWSAEGAR